MKAARFYRPNEPLRLEDIPTPTIGRDEALVEVKACGICHSDLHIIEGKIPVPHLPLVLGHEISGKLVQIESKTEQFSEGDRVLVSGLTSCGCCRFCGLGQDNICPSKLELGIHVDGGYAEFVKVPVSSLFKIPQEISYDEAAILTDAIATPYHAVRVAGIGLGDLVAIYGVGGLGMNAVQLAHLSGARVIAIDVLDRKLKLAEEFGADKTINARTTDPVSKIMEFTGSEGVDVAMEFVGVGKTFEQAIASIRRGGKVVLGGVGTDVVGLSMREMTAKEAVIYGVQAFVAHREYPVLLEMVRKKQLNAKRIVTHRVKLADVNRGLDILRTQEGNPIRVVINP
jgi:2-desacetyl-2-hydroxyethyl bacteriochlorophyllide A dehydrogenase